MGCFLQALTLALAMTLLAVCAQAGPIQVRGDYDYPPYEFLEDGEPTGFNIDIMRAVAEVMGLDIDLSLGPWHQVRSQIESGEIDILTGMYYSPERDMKVDFSSSHIIVYHNIFVRKDSAISSLDDLNGKEVIVQDLDIMHDFVTKKVQAAAVIEVETQADALRLLASGKHHAALLGTLQGLYNAEKYGLTNIMPVGDPMEPREYCLAVPEGREMLLAKLNEGLSIIRQTGKYREIREKWFGRYEREFFSERFWRMALMVFIPLVAVLVLVFVWLWSLKKTVRAKTRELEKELLERERAQKALAESEERYRSIYENILEGYYRTDLHGRILMINPAAKRTLGYPEDADLRNMDLSDLMQIKTKQIQSFSRQLQSKGQVDHFIMSVSRKNGEPAELEVSARVVRDNTGDPVAVEGVFRDVTEQNTNAQRLREALQGAEAASTAKSEFLANMSHEIRTPLNGVLGMLQLLRNSQLDPEQAEYVEIAVTSGQSLLQLISDILDLSKIEAGKIEVEMEQFKLDEVIKAILESFRDQARQKAIDIELEYPGSVESWFMGDAKRIKQMLFNLVGNAVKFTEKGGVKVSVHSLGRSRKGRERLLLIIADTGAGIAAEEFYRIFEPFTQVNGKYNRRYAGTGLGLSIVKRLMDIMGGNIQYDSEEGKGTTVYLRLDLEPVPGAAVRSEQEDGVRLPELKVLVAEDNPVNSLTLMRMLQSLGMEATAVEDGEKALAALAEVKPDLVLMDVQMPVMDGIEATKSIRGGMVDNADPDVPIIAVTAHAMVGDRQKFLEAGMDGYIAKPVDMDNLGEVIAAVLRGEADN